MSEPFVWFDLRTGEPSKAREFYQKLLKWDAATPPDGQGPTVFGAPDRPWAAIVPQAEGGAAWVPYVRVEDVDAATGRARRLGASVLQERTVGPAGVFTVIADPTGAKVALWQPVSSK